MSYPSMGDLFPDPLQIPISADNETNRKGLFDLLDVSSCCMYDVFSKMLEDLSAAQKTFLRYPKGCSGFQQKPEWLLDAFKKSSEIRGSWAQHIRTSSKLFQSCLGGPWAPSDVGWLAHALNPQELNAQMRREKIYRTWMPIRRVIAGHCYRKFHSTAMASIHFCLDGHKETRLWDLLITKKKQHMVCTGVDPYLQKMSCRWNTCSPVRPLVCRNSPHLISHPHWTLA